MLKVVQVGSDVLIDSDAVAFGVGQPVLKSAEEASASRYCDGHVSEFSEDPLPLLDGDALLASQGFEYGEQSGTLVFWQFDGACDGVEEPTQDDLACGPGAIALQEFLEGCGLLAIGFVCCWWLQRSVDSVQDQSSHGGQTVAAPLHQGHEIVDEDIDVAEGSWQRSR